MEATSRKCLTWSTKRHSPSEMRPREEQSFYRQVQWERGICKNLVKVWSLFVIS